MEGPSNEVLSSQIGELRDEMRGSIQEVLDTISIFATHVEGEINGLKQEVGGLKQEVGGLKQEVGGLKQDVNTLKRDVGVIKATMVTKDYLDEKMFKLSGEFGFHLRKEDDKVNALTGLIAEKAVISKTEAKKIAAMGPFPGRV